MNALPTSPCTAPTDEISPEQVAALRTRLKADLPAPEPSPMRFQVRLCPTVRRLLEGKRNRPVSDQAV